MQKIFSATYGADSLSLFHHGYITTGRVGPGHGFQLTYATAKALIAALEGWLEVDYANGEQEWEEDL